LSVLSEDSILTIERTQAIARFSPRVSEEWADGFEREKTKGLAKE
jgi:hypothetical protein